MESGITNTINLLSSSKLKERNIALDELVSLAKHDANSIHSKFLMPILESLIELLEFEKTKYIKLLSQHADKFNTKTLLSESRLNYISYVFRLIIEKTCNRFKGKHIKLLSVSLPELILRDDHRELLLPTSLHLTFALLKLCESNTFSVKFSLHNWISLCKLIFKCLIYQMNSFPNDKSVSNLIESLTELVFKDTIGLQEVLTDILNIIVTYVENYTTETVNTRNILRLTNLFIIKTHLLHFHNIIFLIIQVMKHIIKVGRFVNESVDYEISVFNIIASELIFHKVPPMIGDLECERMSKQSDYLQIIMEYLVIQLQRYPSNSLLIENFQFRTIRRRIKWYQFCDLQLNPTCDRTAWSELLGLTKLIHSYYELFHLNNDNSIPILKRQKTTDSLTVILKTSHTPTEFIVRCIKSTSLQVQILGLQLCSFYLTTYRCFGYEAAQLKDAILQQFDEVSILGWCCIALIPIISQEDFSMKVDDQLKLIKLCLPLIKNPKFCNVSCALLTSLIKYEKSCVTDNILLQQIYDIYELSDFSGPYFLSYESFEFWKYLYRYGRNFNNISQETATTKMFKWLFSKWDQVQNIELRGELFYLFILWLGGRTPNDYINVIEFRLENDQYYHEWEYYSKERDFLLNSNIKHKIVNDKFQPLIAVSLDKGSFSEVLYRLLHTIEDICDSNKVFYWSCEVLRIIDVFTDDTVFLDHFNEFKRIISSTISTLEFDNKSNIIKVMREITDLHVNNIQYIINNELNINQLINAYKMCLLKETGFDSTNDEFIGNRKIKEIQEKNHLNHFYDIKYERSDIYIITQFIIDFYESSGKNKFKQIIETYLELVKDFSISLVFQTLGPLINFLVKLNANEFDLDYLGQLIQFLGSILLDEAYNTSALSMTFLSYFLQATSKVWLNELPGSQINADCNDILDWIIARYDDNSFSSTEALYTLAEFMIHILENFNLSGGPINGGKQRIFGVFIGCLSKLPNFLIPKIIATIKGYAKKITLPNQMIILSEVTSLFTPPQEYVETGAFYSLAMANIANISRFFMCQSIVFMLPYTQYSHFNPYIQLGISKISKDYQFSTIHDLFKNSYFEIISSWFEINEDAEAFPSKFWDVTLFGYKDIDTFVDHYKLILSGFFFSKKYSYSSVIRFLKEKDSIDVVDLLENSLQYAIPLSFIEGGIGDSIFELCNELLESRCETAIFKQRMLIFYWIIKFSDLCDLSNVNLVLSKLFPNSSLKMTMKFNSTVHVQFPLNISLITVCKILRKKILLNNFDHRDLRFLLMRNMVDLECAGTYDESIHIIRRIKCLLIIFEDYLENCDYITILLIKFSKKLDNILLKHEIIPIMADIIQISKSFNFSIEDAFPSITSHIMASSGNNMETTLSVLLEPICYALKCHSVEFRLNYWWNICVGYLKDHKNISVDLFLQDELLNIKHIDSSHIVLYSELLGRLPAFTGFPLDFDFKHNVVQNLIALDTQNSKFTDNFLLWKCNYIGMYFQKYGMLPENKNDILSQYNINNLVQNYGTMSDIFTCLLDGCNSQKEMSYKLLCDVILSVFINTKKEYKKKTLIDNDILFSYTPFDIDYETFLKIYSISNYENVDISIFSSIILSKEICFEEWIVEILLMLFNMLKPFIPILSILIPLILRFKLFGRRLIVPIFSLLIFTDSKVGITIVTEFLSYFKDIEDVIDYDDKIKLMLELFLFVRAAAMLDMPNFQSIYSSLSLGNVYQMATIVKEPKIAYMVMEEAQILDDKCLYQIYSDIDDDLIYGLPVEPTLSSAISMMNSTEPHSFKTFMFSNASYNLNSCINGNRPESVINSSSMNGFTGLAYTLSQISLAQPPEKVYEWCVKLDKWDISFPETLDSNSKVAYTTLKMIHENPTNNQEILRKSMLSLSNNKNFSTDYEWAKAMSTISMLNIIPKLQNDSSLSDLFQFDQEVLKDTEFDDYIFSLSTRQAFIDQLVIAYKDLLPEISKEWEFASIASLVNQSNLARENRNYQESLNSTILLEEKMKTISNRRNIVSCDTLKQFIQRASTIQSAQILWSQKETNISILMLRKLLQIPFNLDSNMKTIVLKLFENLSVSDLDIKTLLAKWLSESRQSMPEQIFESYVNTCISQVFESTDHSKRAKIFHVFAEFCYKEVKKFDSEVEINDLKVRLEKNHEELECLLIIYKDQKLSERERKDAKRHYNRLNLQNSSDKQKYNKLIETKGTFVFGALHFYLNTLVFTNEIDHEAIDKFCGLWFEYSQDNGINQRLEKEIATIPSFKFLPWINQIASKLNINDHSAFQKTLELTMKRILYKLPYESLYSLISIKLHRNYQINKDLETQSRIDMATKILNELEKFDDGDYNKHYILPIEQFCEMCVKLACHQFPSNTKRLKLQNLKLGEYWLKTIKKLTVPLPTNNISIHSSKDGRKSRPYITHVDSFVDISSTGLSLPKIMTFHLSDGTIHKVLMKGCNDDLRQDSIMEQVFKQVNKILASKKDTRKRGLRIRTYEVIPLGPQAGLIEFVANSMSLHEILCRLHKDDDISFDQARKFMKAAQSKSIEERIRVYTTITQSIRPVFRKFFFNSYLNPEDWLKAKKMYTKGMVTTSIVGYILGLGDRHLNNILLDISTGEPIHIDLGVAFEQGKLLPIPELVPFRLTRDFIDGFGIEGVEGSFRKNCERVYKILRDDYERVMCVLNVLKWDPLYSWKMSPLRKRKLQANISDDSVSGTLEKEPISVINHDNDESVRALTSVKDKLLGNGLSVEATIQDLIQTATDVEKLAVIYMGWSPFY